MTELLVSLVLVCFALVLLVLDARREVRELAEVGAQLVALRERIERLGDRR